MGNENRGIRFSDEERTARFDFYSEVFGKERFKNSTVFTGHLWPIEAYQEKVAGLTARGFKDPQKMITSLPAILGYSFDNIDRKLRLSRRLGIDIHEFIAYSVVFMGMSSKNYIPIARNLKESGKEPSPKNVFAVYKAKTFSVKKK